MQAKPVNWDATAGGDYVCKAIINGVEYGEDRLVSAAVHPAVFSSLSIGGAASATLDLSFFPSDFIPPAAKIELYARRTAGDLMSGWAPQGVFYIDSRDLDTSFGYLTLTAYDRMLFVEELYFPGGVISGDWPKSAPEVVDHICQRLGVTLDARSQLDGTIMVSTPVGLTMRDVLRSIAAAHGGNFIMSPAGELRLLLLEQIYETSLLGDENGDYVGSEDGSRIILLDGNLQELPCDTVTSKGDVVAISKVTLMLDDDNGYESGDDSGYALTASCPFATQALADAVLERLRNVRYDPCEAENAVFDPLIEMGDAVYCGGHVFRIYKMDLEYGMLLTATVSAPIETEVNHEIPYKTQSEKALQRTAAKIRAEITMTSQSIRLEVANEIEELSSSIDVQLDSITSQVQGIDDALSVVEQKVDSITLSVTNGTDRSKIELTVHGVVVSSETIRFTGDVVFESDLADGSTLISGDCIQTGEISADYIRLGGEMEVYRTSSSSTLGGYIGYVTSYNYAGTKTSGMGMMEPDGEYQVVVTTGGARLTSPTAEIVAAVNVTLQTDNAVNVYASKFTADVDLTVSSDRNLKDSIQYDVAAKYLPLFDKLLPASFLYQNKEAIRHLGFIAQDVETAAQECGIAPEDLALLSRDDRGYYGLNYSEFIPILVEKIRSLERKLEAITL